MSAEYQPNLSFVSQIPQTTVTMLCLAGLHVLDKNIKTLAK